MSYEKKYLFNPYAIEELNYEQLQKVYNDIYKTIDEEPITLVGHSKNAEIYANLNYIVGEVIVRLEAEVAILKNRVETMQALKTVEERREWTKTNTEKAPAMSYFEALARQAIEKSTDELVEKQKRLLRFKNVFKTMEEKINVVKRKCDAIKYEEFGNRGN